MIKNYFKILDGFFKNPGGPLWKIRKTFYVRSLVRRNGFHFVDIPRTSSSSIRVELSGRFGVVYGKTNLMQQEYAAPQLLKDHIPAREIRALLGKSLWDRIFTFTIVRNPWDRHCSIYHLRRKTNKIPKPWSFRDYILRLQEAIQEKRESQYFIRPLRLGASDFVLGKNGEMLVDYVAKYENREHDLQYIRSRLNFGALGKTHVQDASPGNVHYSAFYDNETKEIIRTLYAKDLELFAYEFEDESG